MMYTNAARVPQDDHYVVWKNSYISPLFPRESIKSAPSKLTNEREPDSHYNVLSTFNLARGKAPNVIGVLCTTFSCKGLLLLVQFYSTLRVFNTMCTPVFFRFL